ncbi:MAG: Gfo/Idh/MocA family oxidoreductase [Candidatus Marinimicrobia bacterium]|nr:Gfo/Idh/MocA family oxidoreductase [Candidatus Neomarinimicrobiota bacterium]
MRIGVIGVGHLGQHHAKHYAKMKDITFSGVFDTDVDRAQLIANKTNTIVFPTLNDLLEASDAVSIVTPTPLHAEVAETCIKAGKHVFIEKPITQTIEQADHLLSLADKNNVLIQVGHIERLNPALMALAGVNIDPKYIEVQRLAPYTTRGTDVPVVLDLMIHDIDIILALVDSPVKNIRASGVSIMTDSVDIANARIRFQNGTVVSMTSSRIAKDKVRKFKIFQKDLYVTIDFLLGLTEIYRVFEKDQKDHESILTAPLDNNGRHREISYEKPSVTSFDAMQMELTNFVRSIRGKEKPIVDGKAGRDALDLAIKIHNMIIEDIH